MHPAKTEMNLPWDSTCIPQLWPAKQVGFQSFRNDLRHPKQAVDQLDSESPEH